MYFMLTLWKVYKEGTWLLLRKAAPSKHASYSNVHTVYFNISSLTFYHELVVLLIKTFIASSFLFNLNK